MKFHLHKNKIDSLIFETKLHSENALLKTWFNEKYIHTREHEYECGSEIEFFIFDEHYQPYPCNLNFIEEVNEPSLIPEIGKFQLEVNSPHFYLTADCLRLLHESIDAIWTKCCNAAHKRGCHLALIGAVPAANEKHIQFDYLTNSLGAHTYNQQVMQRNKGLPLSISIKSNEDRLDLQLNSLAILGHISSFQLHFKVGLNQSVQFYNAAQMITGPFLALCSNSPFFYGKKLWHETRISIFEQLSRTPHLNRPHLIKLASFAHPYLHQSFYELFSKNMCYPRILPVVSDDEPNSSLFHLRAHNNSIFRWNRPIIGFESDNQPHLRIEHRSIPVGPTVVDMVANAAFYYGIVTFFATQETSLEALLPFIIAKQNFYQAAHSGLNAKLTWFNHRKIRANDLIIELIPLACKGLSLLGINRSDVDYYLNIIERRAMAHQNGSSWQIAYIENHGENFSNMLESYIHNQNQEIPVSEWKIRG